MSIRREYLVITVAALLAATGCTGGHRANTAAPASVPPRTAVPAGSTGTGGCGQSPEQHAGLPTWTASAGSLGGIPFVTSTEGNLVGILFGAPLHVHVNPAGPNNKVLWIAREPRDGQPLRLVGHRLTGPAPDVTQTEPADSSPGEIYPSIVDVPAAGCWRFTATWNGHRATVDLFYTA